jgi:hypothetical protein
LRRLAPAALIERLWGLASARPRALYFTSNTTSIGLWSDAIVPLESRVSMIWTDLSASFDADLEVKT